MPEPLQPPPRLVDQPCSVRGAERWGSRHYTISMMSANLVNKASNKVLHYEFSLLCHSETEHKEILHSSIIQFIREGVLHSNLKAERGVHMIVYILPQQQQNKYESTRAHIATDLIVLLNYDIPVG